EEGDFNICNFEAALSERDDYFLRKRKPFVLLANVHKTVPAIQQEKFDLVTLANNHLMDGGKDNLVETIERSEEHTSELQSRFDLVCRLLLEKKKKRKER